MRDVIVVGGGPAGLSAALTLGRARRSALVLDSGAYRNAAAAAVRNYLRGDGVPGADLRRIGREQLASYPTVEIRNATATGAAGSAGDGFTVELAGGGVERARRLLLATGMTDGLPPIDGLAALWGRAAFHCLYCHGFEVRDTAIAVVGGGPARAELALHLRRFSADVILCADGEPRLPPRLRGALERQHVPVRTERIARLEGRDGALEAIVFEGGRPLARSAVFVKPEPRQRSALAVRLGCRLHGDHTVQTDPAGRTGVAGVYAAGDMARPAGLPAPIGAVVIAAASGRIAAGVIDKDLLRADFGL